METRSITPGVSMLPGQPFVPKEDIEVPLTFKVFHDVEELIVDIGTFLELHFYLVEVC